MLTFSFCHYLFGCEKFYYKWSSMIHTYNVAIYSKPDDTDRPEPPHFQIPFFNPAPQTFDTTVKLYEANEVSDEFAAQLIGREILTNVNLEDFDKARFDRVT